MVDQIDALTTEREALWARLQGTSFLTDDEKRSAIGYGPMPVEAPTATADFDTPETEEERFNPYHDELGRFTDAEGDVGGAAGIGHGSGEGASDTKPAKGPQLAQAATPGYPISVLDEDREGDGHIYKGHVNKSDEFLIGRVAGSERNFRLFSVGDKRAGSFSSLESANKLVNSTIAANKETVQAFVKGSIMTGSLPSVYRQGFCRTDREGSVLGERSPSANQDDILCPSYIDEVIEVSKGVLRQNSFP